MKKNYIKDLSTSYVKELTENILPFWLKNCEDKIYGGFFNCFNNSGETLVSHDKYIWSQGRFVWVFSSLATCGCGIFSDEQKAEFLRLAKSGKEFIYNNSLIHDGELRCVFLTDKTGQPKHITGYDGFDASIYADCFAVLGMAAFAVAADDKCSFDFAKMLYDSVICRYEENRFNTFPYPLSHKYRAHGVPMILVNVTEELYTAAKQFAPEKLGLLKKNLDGFISDILGNFTDENNVIREIITAENTFEEGLLGNHQNPGHTLEDMWFISESMGILNSNTMYDKLSSIVLTAFENGWDREFGGLLHFCGVNGGKPIITPVGDGADITVNQVINGWGDKLWWVHAEALYTSLLFYIKTGEEIFLSWHTRVMEYVFDKFPNPDTKTGEWIQILGRDGKPQEKVVALPVKDPYHIIRSLLKMIELIDGRAFHPPKE